jgi:hypothetical protein
VRFFKLSDVIQKYFAFVFHVGFSNEVPISLIRCNPSSVGFGGFDDILNSASVLV